jgi:3-oxoacyl-[acyl-carrier protein] reductase
MEANEIALVTGGGTGIGAACCQGLAKEGFLVAIHYNRSENEANRLSEKIPHSVLIKGDISTEEGVNEIFQKIKSMNKSLAVLVNNAGMNIEAPVALAKVEDFDKIVALNMRGTWLLTKKMIKLMIAQQKGRIINISSVLGFTGNPYQSVYAMTKAAINNFSRTLAAELAPYNVLVNDVAPGFVDTAMTQKLPDEVKDKIFSHVLLQRMGKPEEVADVVSFLATRGTYITGTTIHVNGGMYGG